MAMPSTTTKKPSTVQAVTTAITTSTPSPTTTIPKSTEPENSTLATEVQTTTLSTTNITQTDFPSSTSNATEGSYIENNGGKDNTAAIVGGCVGGIVAVILLVLLVGVVIIKRRRRNRRDSDAVPKLPDKDFLDTLHMERAVHHHRANQPVEPEEEPEPDKRYVNLKQDGETDENTDPSVGTDGYLKKTRNFLGINKPKKHKRKKQQKRADSMPHERAPPVPRESAEYTDGRVPDDNDDQTTDNAHYVNLQRQQRTNILETVQDDKTKDEIKRKDKSDTNPKEELQNAKTNQMLHVEDSKEPAQAKVYENIDHGHYYNLNNSEKTLPVRQSTYENVETETASPAEQDDVYEIP